MASGLPAATIDSVDISPEMLAVGRRRLAHHHIHTVTLHEGDAAALPFDAYTFDVVMSVFGWHELPTTTRHQAIDETIRVLRPGGHIISVDLDAPPTAAHLFGVYLRLAEPPHAREVLGSGLVDAFTGHGLTITGHQPARSWTAPFQIVHAHI
ncbi:class I SAM-dependent methyltransferase [Mycolicibacterium goodii]|uniref:class I SAM-dependent methyltransferase n=1 Tax=Mycolicibacterium goodii TaxID=134601 RepID=UPI0027DFD1F0|nr:class I SAM-dependent methyltransferase [Mycolicibacterium goodii]